MTRRGLGVLGAAGILAGGGTAVGLTQFDASPHSIGSPAATFGQKTPLLTATTTAPVCSTVPAKAWGTRPPVVTTVKGVVYTYREKPPWWHYSTAILKPTMLERVCLRPGLPAKVTMIPVPK